MSGFTVLLLMTVAAVVVLVGIPIVVAIILAARHRSADRSSPLAQAEARVVDKRTLVTSAGSATDQRYYVTFQFPDGNRVELAVPASEAGFLIVGDEGRLDWQGARYLGFAREILR
jgi:hypothetical protein